MISTIIDLAFLFIILLSFFIGFKRGTFKSLFRFIFNLVLLITLWFLMPTLVKTGLNYLPSSTIEKITEYINISELSNLASGLLRIFFAGILWLLLIIVLTPLYWILCAISRRIFFSKEKRKAKKKVHSRFIGAAVGTLQCVLLTFMIFVPYDVIMKESHSKDNSNCLVINNVNVCKYTEVYEKTFFSKILSIGNIDKHFFTLISNFKFEGESINLSNDISSILKLVLLYSGKDIDVSEGVLAIASSFNSTDIKDIGHHISNIKLLSVLIEKVLFPYLENNKDFPAISFKNLKVSNEIETLFNVIAEMFKLPIFENKEISSNYANILAHIDSDFITEFIKEIKNSKIIDQLYEEYLVPKFNDLINNVIEKYGDNDKVSVDTTDIDYYEELEAILTAVSKLVDTNLLEYDQTKDEYKLDTSDKNTMLTKLDKTGFDNFIDSLFHSKLISQVVDKVVSSFVLNFVNDTLGKEYTKADLDLENVSWSAELKNLGTLAKTLADEGIISKIDGESNDILKTILGSEEETLDKIADDLTNSKIVLSLLPDLVEPTIEDSVNSMMSSGTVTLPENIDWKTELKNLLKASKMLYDGGAFEDNFDFNEYIKTLDTSPSNDEVAKLSNYIVSSEIFLSVFPEVVKSQLTAIDEGMDYEGIVWEDEIANLMKAYHLLAINDVFEDGADLTDTVVELLKTDESLDTLLASEIIYRKSVSSIKTQIKDLQFDNEPIVSDQKLEETDSWGRPEWKREMKIIANLLDSTETVSSITSLGETQLQDNEVSAIASITENLLASELLADAVADKINDILFGENAPVDEIFTVEELRNDVNWENELRTANTLIYKINYQLESGITSDNSDGLLAEANDTVLLKKAVQYRIRVALEDTIKESLGESLEIPDGNLSDQEIENLASQWQSSTGFTENEEDIKQALDALVEAFDKEDSTYDKNADLADKLKYLNELFK